MSILHSKILGDGQPLVILHGFLGMADNWKTLGKAFSQAGYNVHLVDQRNHGRSFHSEVFNYDVLAQDLKEYADHHGLQSFHLIGHSMGGKTAMKFASLFPSYIDKLVVADIAMRAYPPHHQYILDALVAVDFNGATRREDIDEQLGNAVHDPGVRMFLMKSLYRVDKNTFGWRFNLPILSQVQEGVGEHFEFTENALQMPTLFIRGGKSAYINDDDEAAIDYAFAKAELKTIPAAGHWLHAEEPQQFYEIVIELFNA